MEKYAVEVDHEKTASKDKKDICPHCGGVINTTTNVPHCKNCGTEQYESKKPKN